MGDRRGGSKLADVSRNLDDEQLLALKKNGGVMQTVAFSSYVRIAPADSPERTAALNALRQEFGLPGNTPLAAGSGRGGRGGGGGRAGQPGSDVAPFAPHAPVEIPTCRWSGNSSRSSRRAGFPSSCSTK